MLALQRDTDLSNRHTKFAVVRSCSWRPVLRARLRINRPRRHHPVSTAQLRRVPSRTRRTIVRTTAISSLVVHPSSTLSILRHTVLRWRRSTVSGYAQISHITAHLPSLNISQGLLEVLDITTRITDLGLDARIDGRVVGGLLHLVQAMDDILLAVDFLYELLHGSVIVAVHDGGVQVPAAGRKKVVERWQSENMSSRYWQYDLVKSC